MKESGGGSGGGGGGGGGVPGHNSPGVVTPLQLLPPEMISGCNRKDCVRLRNLPLDCAVEQILEFLGVHAQHIIQHGVHMVLNTQVSFFIALFKIEFKVKNIAAFLKG